MDTIRKRNRPYGTLISSRSQLYVHLNRTQDAELVGFVPTNCKKSKRDDDDLPRRPTKDLRARRVYSHPLSTDSGLVEIAFPEGSNRLQVCRGTNLGDCSAKIDGLDGPTTLPDAQMCGSSKVNEDEGKQEAEAPTKDAPVTGTHFPLKTKSTLRPRFQGKLYKAPGSVNYKRLFPFLMDTTTDDSGIPILGVSQNDKEVGQEFQLPLSSQSQEEPKQELKTDTAANYCFKDVGSDVPNSGLKHLSSHTNNLECAEASNRSACTSQEFGVLNEERIQTAPPNADIYDNSEVNVKSVDLTGSTRENAGEGLCLKAEKQKDSRKSKSVPRQHLHCKLFKTPGSISYKRLLPFLMDLTKDDSDTSKFENQTPHQEDEVVMHNSKRFQLPLSSQSGEPSIDEHKTDRCPMHSTVESNGLGNYILVNHSNGLSHDNQPELIPSQDLPGLSMQLNSKEVVLEDLSAPSVNKNVENFAIGSKDRFNACSVMMSDLHSGKNVANIVHNDEFKEVNMISRQDNSESQPNDQNILQINSDVSGQTFVHHSSKEKGLTVNYDESKQFVNMKEHEFVTKFPSEGQSLSQLDSNMLAAKENVTSLNHVRVSNDILRSPSEKIISGKSDMEGHSGGKAASEQNGIVLCSRMPSKDNHNKYASGIKNDSESKIKSVLKRYPRFKLLKQSGSLNYKRLLPFLLNSMKDNSFNGHYPKLAKSMDETSLLPISTSNLRLAPVGDSNGCVPMEHGADEHDVLNGLCKSESSNDASVSVQGIDLPITALAPVINEVFTREEEATPALSKSSVFSEVTENSSFLISSIVEKPPETHECSQSLSQLQVVQQLRVPAVDFKKGILKRNPRGCRGLCTCLNCVSFRFHAERAFEFSRNQLLDAEGAAHDLMKELSHLRNMLERSTDGVDNNTVFDGNQVKEACRKAFAAEELAKKRLSQMHDDLNIHCRIASLQPPRVRFAVHVEEKVIQRDC
ncbi:hypothetical protein VNO78_11252 [Psophocarpus tetragonolobus]|uniref:Uncharacterized protein n=1 Tax=Psophocarpus tetragonolobus TaxID=3891 RepID=A0AAN9SM32_PSOTE